MEQTKPKPSAFVALVLSTLLVLGLAPSRALADALPVEDELAEPIEVVDDGLALVDDRLDLAKTEVEPIVMDEDGPKGGQEATAPSAPGLFVESEAVLSSPNSSSNLFINDSYRNLQTHTTWDDGWFTHDSSSYNHQLATMSAVLASAAYNKGVTEQSEYAIVKDYAQLGFCDVALKHYDEPGEDTVGYSFATKLVSYGADTFPVVVVALRGSSGVNEWSSNFNVNTGDKGKPALHQGFNGAAEVLVQDLRAYLSASTHNLCTPNTRLLITGHSRGASVANLVGYKLDKGAIEYVSKHNVFVYTFAASNVSSLADVTSTAYDNIFNIVNTDDIVTMVPPKSWGYSKYGTTLYLPSKSNCPDFRSQVDAVNVTFAPYSDGTAYCAYTSGAILPSLLVGDVLAKDPVANGGYFSNGVGATVYKFMLVDGGQAALSLYDAHRPASYVAWMQSSDGTGLFQEPYGGLALTGSVNVRVFDANEALVAAINGDVVDEAVLENGLAARVVDGVTYIDFPGGREYRLEAQVTKQGSMGTAWKEAAAGGETNYQTSGSDKAVRRGETYTYRVRAGGDDPLRLVGKSTNGVADITLADVKVSAATYTGAPITPKHTVELGGKTLVEGTDYVVSCMNCTNAGTGTLTVTGKGNYAGSKSTTFTIKKAASAIKLAAQSKTYTGKALAYSGKVTKSGSAGKVTYAYYADAACTKVVKAANVKNAATYYVKASLAKDANHKAAKSDAVKFVIKKGGNPVTVVVSAKSAKASSVKKKAVAVAPIAVSKALGKVTYAKVSGASCLTVNKTTGKVTVKKGTKAGSYSVKVKVRAAGDANYAAGAKTVVAKIKVKNA